MTASEPTPRRGSAKRVLIRVALLAGGTLLALVLLEGVSSFLITWRSLGAASDVIAERLHTRHDPALGWVNVPNTRIDDMYGPGRNLTINAQGFRGTRDIQGTAPPGRLRAVCSGDSFTLGFGVDDGDTWVEQLAVLEPRLETVNMGQGGYGVDQAYLWYERDGTPLDHDLHLFAFIVEDFWRMQRDVFHVYPKPVLGFVDDELTVLGTPVPDSAYRFPWLAENREQFAGLRMVQILESLSGLNLGAVRSQRVITDEELPRFAQAIFERLAELNRAKDSTLIVVQLPTPWDHQPNERKDDFRAMLTRELGQRGIHFVDLVEPFREFSTEQIEALFIPEGELDFPGAAGHFSVEGNRTSAQLLLEELKQIPAVAERLAALGSE